MRKVKRTLQERKSTMKDNIRLAIIGQGTMGSMIFRKLMQARFLPPQMLTIRTGNQEKARDLEKSYPGISVTDSNPSAAQNADVIIICCKPLMVKTVLREIKDCISTKTHIISIAGCVTIAEISKIVNCDITKAMPTLLSEINEGISLLCHNVNVSVEKRQFAEDLFSCFSTVQLIKETEYELATDLTSCAPGLFSAMFDEFVKAAIRIGYLNPELIKEMVLKTMFGFGQLLNDKHLSFENIISMVATKGGITGEGVKVLRSDLPNVFDSLFRVTIEKHETNKKLVEKS